MSKNRFVMVSDWLDQGNIEEFAKKSTGVDRLGLVCCLFKPVTPRLSLTSHDRYSSETPPRG